MLTILHDDNNYKQPFQGFIMEIKLASNEEENSSSKVRRMVHATNNATSLPDFLEH